jgi:ribonuclease inhibitor
MRVVLPGRKICSEGDLHDVLTETLDLGEYYGRNTSALWDRLTTDVPRPIDLVWEDWEFSKSSLGAAFDEICELFREVEAQDLEWGLVDRFTFRLG